MTEIMTKQEFVEQINLMEETIKQHRMLLDNGEYSICPDCDLFNEFLEVHISNISTLVEDDNYWLAWYVFDTNFGRKNTKVKRVSRKDKRIDTPVKLYNLIRQQASLIYTKNHSEYPVDEDCIGAVVYIDEDYNCANIKVYSTIGYGILVDISDDICVVDKYKELEYIK